MRSHLFVAIVAALVACSDRFASDEQAPIDASTDASEASDASSDVVDEHAAHAAACDTIGRTGASDTCKLFAYCGHQSFEVDCSARFTCICSEPDLDGGPTKQVVAEPIFCGSADNDLKSAFAAAHRACGWQ